MKATSTRLDGLGESVFSTMTALANEHGAINLSQGFPDFDGPAWIKELASKHIIESSHQYAPMPGTPMLRASLKNLYKKFYDLDYCDQTEITITCGATEGIFSTVMSLVSPGDEVVVFEPFYDSYVASIKIAGGVVKSETLKAPDFRIDFDSLEKALNEKTKLIIVNSPHNPAGGVWTSDELTRLVTLAEKHDVYILSDEVYEFLTFDGHKHIPTACIPEAKDRVITLSSAGKTFGYTGWKIGWTCANPQVTTAIRRVHQYNLFSIVHPLQNAVAEALDNLDNYLPDFKKLYKDKRDLFFQGLVDCGLSPIKPEGTYFMFCAIPESFQGNDIDFAKELILKAGVASIPPSAFYLNSDDGTKYLRFCFARSDETLNCSLKALEQYFL